MESSRVPSSSCAVLLIVGALCFAPLSCKDAKQDADDKGATKRGGDDDKGATKRSGDDDKTGAAEKAHGGADKGDTKGGGELAGLAAHTTEIITGPRDIKPSYPAKLEALLDLVPADADTFIIIRDVGALVDGTLGYLEAGKHPLERLGTEIEKEDPANAKKMREGLAKVVEFDKAIRTSGINMSAGAILASKGDDKPFIVYGSATADALPTLLTAAGATGDLPTSCETVASLAGYMVCTKMDAKAYAPGSKAAELRKKVAAELPGVDLERANIVAHITTKKGRQIPFAIETGQGMAHISISLPQTREDVRDVLQASKGRGLGMVGPGQPFLWAQGSTKKIAEAGASAPKIVKNVVKTLTGEFLMGGLGNTTGFGVMLGVNDPAPTTGLVGLASLFGLDKIPTELPDGTKLESAVKTISGTQAVHIKASGGGPAKLLKGMGYTPQVFGFAAGQYAAITLGADEAVVEAVAAYKGDGPSKELLEALPTPLAKAIETGEVAFAMHMPLDALQSERAIEAFGALASEVPAGGMGELDPAVAVALFADLLAPVSSGSFWISHLDDGPVFHVVVQGFGEPGTTQGQAALDALSAVAGGADRKSTYAALLGKYGSSLRASSYKARAGELGDPFSSILVVGAIGAGLGAAVFSRGEPSVGFAESATAESVVATPTPAPTK